MADRRGARVSPVIIPGAFTGAALIDSPSGVLAPGALCELAPEVYCDDLLGRGRVLVAFTRWLQAVCCLLAP
jgi:hypothetical protein